MMQSAGTVSYTHLDVYKRQKQHFKMPYIGLTGNYLYDSFEFGGSFKYSGWVKASDNDEHYNRCV